MGLLASSGSWLTTQHSCHSRKTAIFGEEDPRLFHPTTRCIVDGKGNFPCKGQWISATSFYSGLRTVIVSQENPSHALSRTGHSNAEALMLDLLTRRLGAFKRDDLHWPREDPPRFDATLKCPNLCVTFIIFFIPC